MHQAVSASSVSPKSKARLAQRDKLNPALERLQTGVRELLDSQAWREALKFKARFHHYSFNNALLIYLQRPDATLVAGYKRWQELGRQVRKGETSIAILAPIVCKMRDEEGGEEVQRVIGFRLARVFDVSQTDGDPLPEFALPGPAYRRQRGDSGHSQTSRSPGDFRRFSHPLRRPPRRRARRVLG